MAARLPVPSHADPSALTRPQSAGGSRVPVADAAGLNLRRTLDSGQAFRWRWEACADGGEIATGIVGRHVLRATQDPGGVRLLSPDTAEARDTLRRYLGLDSRRPAPARDTGRPPRGRRRNGARPSPARVETALAHDAVLARILPHTRGTGLLVQDPWEVLISFIVSQNNNIARISGCIERLARAYGEAIGNGAYAFPRPAGLAAARLEGLEACGLGYRAPYVLAAARRIAAGRIRLEAIRDLDEDAARSVLRTIPGVGEKVGDCVLLFGLGRLTVFPVDVWVRRAVERLYFRGRPRPLREIRAFARVRFGPLAGYAQQHLFAYARRHLRRAAG